MAESVMKKVANYMNKNLNEDLCSTKWVMTGIFLTIILSNMVCLCKLNQISKENNTSYNRKLIYNCVSINFVISLLGIFLTMGSILFPWPYNCSYAGNAENISWISNMGTKTCIKKWVALCIFLSMFIMSCVSLGMIDYEDTMSIVNSKNTIYNCIIFNEMVSIFAASYFIGSAFFEVDKGTIGKIPSFGKTNCGFGEKNTCYMI